MERCLIECLRFSGDLPSASASEEEIRGIASQFGERNLAHCLVSSLEISQAATPEVFGRIEHIVQKIGSVPWRGFIEAGAHHQASCFLARTSSDSDEWVVVSISSQLVRDFSEVGFQFVIGHELGHAILGHHGYPGVDGEAGAADKSALFDLARCAEFSADRIGLFLSGNASESIRACVQLASGLPHDQVSKTSGEHYLKQIDQIADWNGGVDISAHTHPPLPLRAMNLYQTALAIHESGGSIHELEERMREVDARIYEAMARLQSGGGSSPANKWVDLAAYWAVVAYFAADNRFTENEQAWLGEVFGKRRLEGALRFVSTYKRESTREALALFARQCPMLRDSRRILAGQVRDYLEQASGIEGDHGSEQEVLAACTDLLRLD